LAAGRPLDAAIADAKDFVWEALSAGSHMQIGKGRNGPIDHNFALRKL
jgi:hydroxymethylpyrimidine/phosphomethylpyrimidine kinase